MTINATANANKVFKTCSHAPEALNYIGLSAPSSPEPADVPTSQHDLSLYSQRWDISLTALLESHVFV